MSETRVYLDINASTPMAPEVVTAVSEALVSAWGNPSSCYGSGMRAKCLINKARESVARMIGAVSSEIIFMSGGTEANNTVLNSMLRYYSDLISTTGSAPNSDPSAHSQRPHIITTNLEHDSISKVLQHYTDYGLADVTTVNASPLSGEVEVPDIMAAVRPNTCLISVMLANNETGIIQPVGEICQARNRLTRLPGAPHVYVHTDAAQAIGKIRVNVNLLMVDYLTIVGHKFYGPRIGALYVKDPGTKTPITPLLFGGGQERGLRSGTENTPMIVGLGKAAELVSQNWSEYLTHMASVRDYLEHQLQVTFGGEVCINARYDCSTRLPNTCSVAFKHPLAHGVSVLSGCRVLEASVTAACHSQQDVSATLIASGVPPELARNSLRLSVGRETSHRDIDKVVQDLQQALKRISDRKSISDG